MNRREFLRSTSTVAVGLATLGSRAAAATPKPGGLIDTNVSLGRWPFRRLPLDETPKLVAKLRRHGVTQVWVGSFDAAFGKDLAAANARLADECRKLGRDLLVPFGSVNVALPDWQEEFNRCVEKYRMRGLRLFPNYHGYKLDDPAFEKLLSLAARKQLVVQIAADLEDERTQPASAAVPHVDVKPLLELVKKFPDARVMLLNWHRVVKPELVRQLATSGVSFDIATVENVGGVAELIEKISPERVMFGSHAPFFYFESALLKLKESALSETQSASVRELNARHWLA